jgi:hypothetical protein
MRFWQMLQLMEGPRRTGAKTLLYPLGYDGIGLYPVGDNLTHAADALTYLSFEDRKYKGQDGPPFTILHLHCDFDCNDPPDYVLPTGTVKPHSEALPADTSTSQKRYIPD